MESELSWERELSSHDELATHAACLVRHLGRPVGGVYTCFHIAHREAWKKYLYKENKKVIDQVYCRIEGKEEDGIVVIQPPRKKSRK